jgi:hypothetical protein
MQGGQLLTDAEVRVEKNEKRIKHGLSVALSIALALVGASHPIPWLIVVACIAIASSLLYAFWGWASRASLSTVEKLARPVILFIAVAVVSVLYGLQFWPTIIIRPSEIPRWTQYIEYTFSVTNKTDDDAYRVLAKFNFSKPPRDFEFRPTTSPLRLGADKATHVLITCQVPPVAYLTSHHLAPGEKTTLVLRYTKSKEASVRAEIIRFSREPAPYFNGPLGTWTHVDSLPFGLDEDCQGYDMFLF